MAIQTEFEVAEVSEMQATKERNDNWAEALEAVCLSTQHRQGHTKLHNTELSTVRNEAPSHTSPFHE